MMSSYSVSTAGSFATRFSNLNLNTSNSISKLLPSSSICVYPLGTSAFSMSVRARGGGAKFKGTRMRERKLTEEMIESKVMDATEMCDGKTSVECRVAWDEVEVVSQAKAHLRVKLEKEEDPLRSFCSENAETDECVISYD